jgi:regulator of protease activity HflC (stomatin/prohibitin superfamily)
LTYLVVSEGTNMVWGVCALVLLVALVGVAGWRRVPAGCVATLQRRGRYRQAVAPGWHWLVPGFERLGPPVPLIGHRLDVRTTAARAALHFQILEPERVGAGLDGVDDWVGAQAREALRATPDAADDALKHELNRRVAAHGVRVVRCSRGMA